MKLPTPTGVTPEDARLAWELVANISSIGDIMRRHRLTFDELDAKKRDPLFANLVHQYEKHWNSELSVNQRVALKAALLTEDTLLDVYAIVKNAEASPGQRLEAFGALAKAGEVGVQRKAEGPTGAPVQINITIPGQKGVTIDASPVEALDADVP